MTDSSAPFTFKGKGRSPPSSAKPTFTFVYPPAAGQPAWTAQNADDEPPPPGSSSYAKPLSKASKKGLPRKPRKKVKLENAGVEEGERTESDETNDESPMEPRKDDMDYIKFDMADIAAAGAHKRKRDDYSSPARDRTAIMQSMDVLTPLPIPPWARDISQYSKDAAAMFNEEAEDYVRFIAPTAAEQAMRLLTVERIRAVAKSLWPTCEVKIFGSFETGLYLPTSDVDVVVQGAPFSENSLHNLADALTRYSMVSKVDVISKARVPIIKTVDSLTRFPCDISFNIVSGTEAAVIVQRLLGDVWCGEGIRGLMYLMKQFLAQRLLNEPFSGGLGSYALLAMVASFMKMHPLVQSGQLTPEKNLGILFLEFLELYGSNFNYFKVGIGMNSDGSSYYFNKQMRHQRQTTRRPGILTILDPQDNTNDVGAGAYNFHYIRTEFTRAHARVTTMIGAYFQRQMKILAAPRHSSSKRSSSRHTHRHYDSDDSDDNVGKPKSEHTHPNTFLGSILAVKRGFMESRMYIEELAADVQTGKCETGLSKDVIMELMSLAPTILPKPVSVKVDQEVLRRREMERQKEEEEIARREESELERELNRERESKKRKKDAKKEEKREVKNTQKAEREKEDQRRRSEWEREREKERDYENRRSERDRERERGRDKERDRERDREIERKLEEAIKRDRRIRRGDRDKDEGRYYDKQRELDREREKHRERDRDYDRDILREGGRGRGGERSFAQSTTSAADRLPHPVPVINVSARANGIGKASKKKSPVEEGEWNEKELAALFPPDRPIMGGHLPPKPAISSHFTTKPNMAHLPPRPSGATSAAALYGGNAEPKYAVYDVKGGQAQTQSDAVEWLGRGQAVKRWHDTQSGSAGEYSHLYGNGGGSTIPDEPLKKKRRR